jgi:hypothetical protein
MIGFLTAVHPGGIEITHIGMITSGAHDTTIMIEVAGLVDITRKIPATGMVGQMVQAVAAQMVRVVPGVVL